MPLATRPTVISTIGPIPATPATISATILFIPSGISLNLLNNLTKNSITGVRLLAKTSPIGAIDAFSFSICCCILFIAELS